MCNKQTCFTVPQPQNAFISTGKFTYTIDDGFVDDVNVLKGSDDRGNITDVTEKIDELENPSDNGKCFRSLE